MVRVGIIGCGKISERASLPNLMNYRDHCRVVFLCDIVRKKAESLADRFNLSGPRITTDWRRLVASRDVDAVFVNTPNYLHEPMAVGAARCGKHVLVEKPLSISIKAAENMIRSARRAGICMMVEQTHRFDPVHQAAKRVIDSGVLGKIHNIRGRIGHAGPEYWSQGQCPWYYQKRKSGGGCLVDIGVHICDLLRWFKGRRVSEVFATIQTLEKRLAVEDNATVLLRFEDGSKGEFECSWTTRPYEVMTFVYGQEGKLTTNIGGKEPVAVTLAKTAKGLDPNFPRSRRHPAVGRGAGWENAIHHFIDCLNAGRRPLVPAEEGRETMRVILAAYASQKTRRWVRLAKGRA